MSTVVLNENTPSIKYLCQKDKRLAKVISTIGEISYTTHSENPYAFMIHEIIEQMLSIKALTGSVLVGNINFSEFSTMSDSGDSSNQMEKEIDYRLSILKVLLKQRNALVFIQCHGNPNLFGNL